MAYKPFRRDLRHDAVGLMDPLAALELEREGQGLGDYGAR
jgi:hypothetical protein